MRNIKEIQNIMFEIHMAGKKKPAAPIKPDIYCQKSTGKMLRISPNLFSFSSGSLIC